MQEAELGDPRRLHIGGVGGLYRLFSYSGKWESGRRHGFGVAQVSTPPMLSTPYLWNYKFDEMFAPRNLSTPMATGLYATLRQVIQKVSVSMFFPGDSKLGQHDGARMGRGKSG
jgi:hypothetical protein